PAILRFGGASQSTTSPQIVRGDYRKLLLHKTASLLPTSFHSLRRRRNCRRQIRQIHRRRQISLRPILRRCAHRICALQTYATIMHHPDDIIILYTTQTTVRTFRLLQSGSGDRPPPSKSIPRYWSPCFHPPICGPSPPRSSRYPSHQVR